MILTLQKTLLVVFLSITFVAILDTVFSIQDTSLKLTFVAFLSSTGAIGFCNVMNKTKQNKK